MGIRERFGQTDPATKQRSVDAAYCSRYLGLTRAQADRTLQCPAARFDSLIQNLTAFAALGLDPSEEALLLQSVQRAIDQLSVLKRVLRRERKEPIQPRDWSLRMRRRMARTTRPTTMYSTPCPARARRMASISRLG